jgi:hypothetical protein
MGASEIEQVSVIEENVEFLLPRELLIAVRPATRPDPPLP